MFEEFDSTVLEFMREFGGDAIYTKQGESEYDTLTGTVTAISKNIPVRGILLDYPSHTYGRTVVPGTEIIAGDKQFLMLPPQKDSGFPLVIETVNDRVKIGNTQYSVVVMKEINPTGSDTILYELMLRH